MSEIKCTNCGWEKSKDSKPVQKKVAGKKVDACPRCGCVGFSREPQVKTAKTEIIKKEKDETRSQTSKV